jgi:hypothetical protein
VTEGGRGPRHRSTTSHSGLRKSAISASDPLHQVSNAVRRWVSRLAMVLLGQGDSMSVACGHVPCTEYQHPSRSAPDMAVCLCDCTGRADHDSR